MLEYVALENCCATLCACPYQINIKWIQILNLMAALLNVCALNSYFCTLLVTPSFNIWTFPCFVCNSSLKVWVFGQLPEMPPWCMTEILMCRPILCETNVSALSVCRFNVSHWVSLPQHLSVHGQDDVAVSMCWFLSNTFYISLSPTVCLDSQGSDQNGFSDYFCIM